MAVSSGISHTEVHGRGPQLVGRASDGPDKPCSSVYAPDQLPEYKPDCHINEELVRPPVRPLQPSRRLSQQRPRRAPKGRPRLRRGRRRPGRQGSPTRYKRAGCPTRRGGPRGQPLQKGECRPEPPRRPEPTADRQETPSRETQGSGLAEGVAGPGGADAVRLAGPPRSNWRSSSCSTLALFSQRGATNSHTQRDPLTYPAATCPRAETAVRSKRSHRYATIYRSNHEETLSQNVYSHGGGVMAGDDAFYH